ncbi:citramalate synthase [Lignipirellula cremea]|uniref:Citramalate synthase n=1 Tax=Lignipirellula cremea TaxID=2528010 RepID=A0A518E514_9BACT|nr:citramalate synthase [Lignipirellula cremea]QDU99158.1 2-isopropylmalate synthase [Lignipirellula cremea]
MTRAIQIYDTTLRDGAQGEGVSFSLHDKLQIALRLDEMGVDFIEGGYPLSNEKDFEFFQRIKEMPLKSAQICAFGMTRRKNIAAEDDPGLAALVESMAPVCTVVGKTSDFQVTEVLRVSLEENLAMIADSVAFLVGAGRQVIYDAEHFFDGWKRNPEYAALTIQAAVDAGAMMIVACDTNGGAMPEEIARILQEARTAMGDRKIDFGIHCHNDCDLAVANSLAGVEAGAVQVQGTINGVGERCGNADLISVIANLSIKKQGYTLLGGRGTEHLTELSRYVYETANMHLRANQPFVGQSAFAHKGGMHVSAIARSSESYEHINPESVGNERRILVSELSGRSNIVALTTKFNLQHDQALMDQILAQVVALENQGYQFEAAEASFDLLVKKCVGVFEPHFQRIKYHVSVSSDDQKQITTEATVKLLVDGEQRHEVAEGDGPVNALDAALRKALHDKYPELRAMRLVDYKVRVVNSDAGTAARIRVMVESCDDHHTWGTIGVSENIIEASWIALNDAIEYKLYKERQKSPVAAATV